MLIICALSKKLPIEILILDDRFAFVSNDTREQKRHAFLSSEFLCLRRDDVQQVKL
ncbi:MAG: hypothetical protein ACYCSW_07070 [bacterium]